MVLRTKYAIRKEIYWLVVFFFVSKFALKLRSLRDRGLAGEDTHELTRRGLKRLSALSGVSGAQQSRAARFFPDPPHYAPKFGLLSSLVRRFVGQNLEGKKFLELGCIDFHAPYHGVYVPSFLLHLVRQGADAHGIDLREMSFPQTIPRPASRPEQVKYNRSLYDFSQNQDYMRRLRVVKGDLTGDLSEHFPDNNYHAILCNSVVHKRGLKDETPFDADRFLQNVRDRLMPNGYFIATSMNLPLFTREDLERNGFRVKVYRRVNSTGIFLPRFQYRFSPIVEEKYCDHVVVACKISRASK